MLVEKEKKYIKRAGDIFIDFSRPYINARVVKRIVFVRTSRFGRYMGRYTFFCALNKRYKLHRYPL